MGSQWSCVRGRSLHCSVVLVGGTEWVHMVNLIVKKKKKKSHANLNTCAFRGICDSLFMNKAKLFVSKQLLPRLLGLTGQLCFI